MSIQELAFMIPEEERDKKVSSTAVFRGTLNTCVV